MHVMIGPVPPPLGGISVYVARRSRRLREEGNVVVTVDLAKESGFARLISLAKIIFDPRPTRYELHTYDFSAMAAILSRPFEKGIVYMDHNTLLYGHAPSGIRRAVLKRFMARAHVAFVSEAGRDFYRGSGFEFGSSEVRNAYLPPPAADEPRIIATYDAATTAFLDSADPLLVANASQIIFVGADDLYGLDMCVELLARVRDRHPNARLLFALADDRANNDYLGKIQRRLADAGIDRHFHFLTGQRELWPVFKRARLMLRPTTGDGFAVSVAEALDLGCPVLASDAVARPEGVTVFRNRDIDDFVNKALDMLDENRVERGE